MRKVMLAVAMVVLPFSAIAADVEELLGTWKLVSSTRKTLDTGEVTDTWGKNPKGYITYGKDGRMMAVVVNDARPKPESLDKMTDQQRVDLYRTMVAYAGTYTFDGNKIAHHVDVSWNEVWTGTTVVRDIKKEGDKLIYTTRPAPFGGDGKMSVLTVVFEKVK